MRIFLTPEELLVIHQHLIFEFGGSHGLRDQNALEATAMRPQTGYYQNIFEEAAALMESLAMNHPFIDGNKRMAFFAADTFLRINGYCIDCDDQEAYDYFISLFESSSFGFEKLSVWIRQNSKPLQ